jgi:hypothetical protein
MSYYDPWAHTFWIASRRVGWFFLLGAGLIVWLWCALLGKRPAVTSIRPGMH